MICMVADGKRKVSYDRILLDIMSIGEQSEEIKKIFEEGAEIILREPSNFLLVHQE